MNKDTQTEIEDIFSKNKLNEDSVNEDEKEEKKPKKWDFLSFVVFLVLVVVFTFLFVEFIGQRTRVSGSSMENTLQDGDNLFVDKISYRFHDPERFDIIIFPPRNNPETHYIKRIIGLPGETVQIDAEGRIYIDGVVLKENYGREKMKSPGIAVEPIILGENEFFVLGDNRNNSTDSRSPQVGVITGDEIIGKAFIRIYPFNKIGFIKHA